MRRLVSVVDDDESVRESLPELLKSMGFESCSFASAEEFLSSDCLQRTGCLVLDVVMPGLSGPGLQQELARRKHNIPIVFVTAHSYDSVRPHIIETGTVVCLTKPFSEKAILDAVTTALDQA